jgi:uncharacterized coiled-coil protein SlyX
MMRRSIATAALAGLGSIALNNASIDDLTARIGSIEVARDDIKNKLNVLASRLEAAETDLGGASTTWSCNALMQCELVAAKIVATEAALTEGGVAEVDLKARLEYFQSRLENVDLAARLDYLTDRLEKLEKRAAERE